MRSSIHWVRDARRWGMGGLPFSLGLLVAVVFCASGFAKDKDKDKDAGADVKFTSRTELVLVPTIVTEKSGAHMSGLKKEDFTIMENGSARQIATFEEITSDPERWSRPANVRSSAMSGQPGKRGRIHAAGYADCLGFAKHLPGGLELCARATAQVSVAIFGPAGTDGAVHTGTSGDPGDTRFHDRSGSADCGAPQGDGGTPQLVDTAGDIQTATGAANPVGSERAA